MCCGQRARYECDEVKRICLQDRRSAANESGANWTLSATINDKVLPILKKQKGFVDEMVFVSDKVTTSSLASSNSASLHH